MKTCFALCVALLFCLQAFPQNSKLDSLTQLIQKAPSDTARIKLELRKMRLLTQLNLDSAINLGEKALAETKQINYYRGTIDLSLALARNYFFKGNYKAGNDLLSYLKTYIHPSKDSADFASLYATTGTMYGMQSKYDSSIEFYKKAIRIEERANNKAALATSYTNIAIGYQQQSNFPMALFFQQKGLQLAEEKKDTVTLGHSYLNLAITYQTMNEDSLAERNYLVALDLVRKHSMKDVELYAYDNLAGMYTDLTEWEKAYEFAMNAAHLGAMMGDQGIEAASLSKAAISMAHLKDFDKANALIDHALIVADSSQQPINISEAQNVKGSILSLQGKYAEAIPHFERGIALVQGGDAYTASAHDDYQKLSTCYEKTGNYVKAIATYKKAAAIADSVMSKNNIRKTTELTMNYEFDKKQAAQKAEQDKKDAIAQATLARQTLVKNISIGVLLIIAGFLVVLFFQKNRISKEKKRSEELLLNILPAETAEELKSTGAAKAKSFDLVTVMFTDFKNFTLATERMSAEELVREINYCYSAFDEIITRRGIEKIKTIGDSYMCAGGLPVKNVTHPEDVIFAAFEIRDFILNRKKEREENGEIAFEMRIGIHTGPIVAGIVGIKKFAYDIWGDTVNIAARMEQSGEPGRVNISGDTYHLVDHQFRCVYRGKIAAKNKKEMDMYFVEEALLVGINASVA